MNQVQEKMRACGNTKWQFLSSCFIAGQLHKNYIITYSSFQRKGYFVYFRKRPLIKIFSYKNTWKLLWFIRLPKSSSKVWEMIYVKCVMCLVHSWTWYFQTVCDNFYKWLRLCWKNESSASLDEINLIICIRTFSKISFILNYSMSINCLAG